MSETITGIGRFSGLVYDASGVSTGLPAIVQITPAGPCILPAPVPPPIFEPVDEEDAELVSRLFGSSPKNELLKFRKARLCQAGVNLNGDGVTPEGLEQIASTISLMALDDEHEKQTVIGFIVNPRVEDNVLLIDGIVYARRFPEIASQIVSGKKKLSIEAFADEAQCSICGGRYVRPSDYCEHLKGRAQSGAVRWLSGLRGVGGGATLNPAFPAMGFDTNSLVMIASLQGASNSEDAPPLAARETGEGAQEESMELEELKATLERVQAELEAKSGQLDAAATQIAELSASLSQAETDLQAAKAQLDAQRVAHARGLDLIEAGFGRDEVSNLEASLARADEALVTLLKSTKIAARSTRPAAQATVIADAQPTRVSAMSLEDELSAVFGKG